MLNLALSAEAAFQDMRLNWQFNSYMELVVGCGFTPEFIIRVAVSAAVEFHLQKCGRLPNLSTHAVGCQDR
jgi:hypothetical protein